MTPSLGAIDLKLERASAHIASVAAALDQYARTRPYTIRVDLDADGVTGRFVAVQTPDVPPLDPSVLLFVGEALYQLRSALDHLVHQLAAVNGSPVPDDDRGVQFPIYCDPDEYNANRARRLRGVCMNSAEPIIRAAQPFAVHADATTHDALWMLQTLNNTDKHRTIPVCTIALESATLRTARESLAIVQGRDVVLEHGKTIWSFRAEHPYPNLTADVNCAVAFAAFVTPDRLAAGVDTDLWSMYLRAASIVNDVRPLF